MRPIYLLSLFAVLCLGLYATTLDADSTLHGNGVQAQTKTEAPAGVNSVRQKVCPVTYGGPTGGTVSSTPSGNVRDKVIAPAQPTSSELSKTPPAHYRMRVELDPPASGSNTSVAAKDCAHRLMTLVQQRLVRDQPLTIAV